jgi:hypothetical protein
VQDLAFDGGAAIGFYVTQNSGRSWSLASMIEDPIFGNTGRGLPMAWSAIDTSTWYLSVYPAHQYVTRDQGRSWELIASAGLDNAELVDMQFQSEASGWGLELVCETDEGCSQPMFGTQDGGLTWEMMTLSP